MSHKLAGSFAVLTMSLAVSLAHGEPRRGGGGGRSGGERSTEERSGEERSGERSGSERSSSQSKKGKKPPGGDWSESNSEGKQGKEQSGKEGNKSGEEGAAAGAAHSNRNSSQASGAEGAAAGAAHSNKNSPQATGAEGAAAGAAASNRNSPKASGAEGAAAGAAASNRNEPQHSGAEGAAAGAAASNRNNPKYSGAQGAAAGAAASNRNSPQYSGAQGAAAGAAVSNRNNPQYSGAQGAAVGAANSPQYSGAAGAAAGYAAVRNNVNHPGMYSQQWYGAHQGAWVATGWNADAAWTAPTWAAVAGQFGYDNAITPITYNYGSNVTCIGGNVVVDGRPAGTAEEFSLEADELAEKGTTAATSPSDQWLPLGVFALVRNEQQHPQLIMQLAINQAGILRGNYTDEITDSTLPVHGAVDRKTQRVAFTIGENKYSVMEVGLNNLTQSEAPALIHKNGTTQKWLLVRLSQASQAGNDAAAK